MRVGQVCHLYRPSIGGIENYVDRLNDSVRDAGHEGRTFTTDLSLDVCNDDGPLEPDETAAYCRTLWSPIRNPLSLDLFRRIRRSNCDVYHLHSPWYLTSFVAAAALSREMPTVMTVHSATIESTTRLLELLNLAYQPFAEYVFQQVDHAFVQGKTERDRLRRRLDFGDTPVSVVPNGIDPSKYEFHSRTDGRGEQRSRTDTGRQESTGSEKMGMDSGIAARDESWLPFDLDPELPTVLYVSRLVSEKNPGVFVDALSDYLEDYRLQALVVGDGPPAVSRRLRQRADDRINFHANLTFEELQAAYGVADIFTFLGTWEGLPTVVLEAMSAGLPVVSTPAGAIPDAIQTPEYGTIVSSPPNPREVATAIRYYLDQPSRRRAIGKRASERVRTEFHWNNIADEILDTYRAVV